MRRKTVSFLSIFALILGAAIGGYGLVKIYMLRAVLPSGVCPVINNRPFLYIGIALLALSFILSTWEHYLKKREH